ncbi:MAG: iron ABC transporter permease [Eubacteriales bacterium]|nr:iron ABC transporter permease [Eubacteriales bacterium]
MKKICKLMKDHVGITCMVLAGLLILSIILGIGIGPVSIPFGTVWKVVLNRLFGIGDVTEIPVNTQNIVWHLRVPRVLLGGMVGVCLTISGVAMQSFTKNPLASPYVLGISSGASFGATLAMATGVLSFLGSWAVQVGAFGGAMAAILIVYYLAKSGKEVAPIKLVLVGTAVSAMFTAFSNFIVYKAPDETKVKQVTFWMLGSIASAEWTDLIPLAVVFLPGTICLYAFSSSLNAMLMGESSAVTLGVNVNLVRKITVFLSAVMTGIAVSVAGSIGFVGLVIPHIVRSMVGADHHKVIPISAFLGAIFLIWVDVGARMLDAPSEIPIGIITSMIGAPVFLWMIRVRKYSFGNKS